MKLGCRPTHRKREKREKPLFCVCCLLCFAFSHNFSIKTTSSSIFPFLVPKKSLFDVLKSGLSQMGQRFFDLVTTRSRNYCFPFFHLKCIKMREKEGRQIYVNPPDLTCSKKQEFPSLSFCACCLFPSALTAKVATHIGCVLEERKKTFSYIDINQEPGRFFFSDHFKKKFLFPRVFKKKVLKPSRSRKEAFKQIENRF